MGESRSLWVRKVVAIAAIFGIEAASPGAGSAAVSGFGACCTATANARGTQGGGSTQSQNCLELTQIACESLMPPGRYQGDFTICSGTDCVSTPTPTVTPTATVTGTPVSPGQACMETADCAGGLVCDPEELVCCDRLCNEPLERCDLPGLEGTCSPITAPAPAASQSAMAVSMAMLLALGGVAIARRRLSRSAAKE
jgi:hypothetical protein